MRLFLFSTLVITLRIWNFGRLISYLFSIDTHVHDFRMIISFPVILCFRQRGVSWNVILNSSTRLNFACKLDDSVMETYNNICMHTKMYGDEALSRAQVFRWHKNLKNGGESFGDEPRSGRPVEARTDNNVQRKEFVPPGQTVYQHVYLKVLNRLRKRVIEARSDITKTWILHHDNVQCFQCVVVFDL